MFNVGTPELLVILLVALIVLGPDKLPHAARQVGKYMGEFRRMSSGFQDELRDAMQEPVSSITGTLKGDPVPKATPAADVKPVSQVLDTSLPGASPVVVPAESAAADPSSASLGGPVPEAEPADVDPAAEQGAVAQPRPQAPSPPTSAPTAAPQPDAQRAPAPQAGEAAGEEGVDEHGGGDDEAAAPVGGAGTTRSNADLT